MSVKQILQNNFIIRIALYLAAISVIFTVISLWSFGKVTDQMKVKRALLNSRGNIQLNFEGVLELYQQEYTRLNSNLQQLLPATTKIIDILENIDRNSNQLRIDAKISNIPLQDNLDYIRYIAKFDGSNKQLLDYLEMLNNLPVYTEIQSINSVTEDGLAFDQLASHQIIFDIFTQQ